MAQVRWTRHLERFFPDLAQQAPSLSMEAASAGAVVQQLEQRFAGIAAYLVDERGELRRHVNIFIDGELVKDRRGLTDSVKPDSQVVIMQALSGG